MAGPVWLRVGTFGGCGVRRVSLEVRDIDRLGPDAGLLVSARVVQGPVQEGLVLTSRLRGLHADDVQFVVGRILANDRDVAEVATGEQCAVILSSEMPAHLGVGDVLVGDNDHRRDTNSDTQVVGPSQP